MALTAAGRVVAGHLAKVGMVLDCIHSVSGLSRFRLASCVGMSAQHILLFNRLGLSYRSCRCLVAGSLWEVERTLRAEELAGDVEGLAADDDDLLAVEELLGDNAGEAAEEMALAVDNDLEASMLATSNPDPLPSIPQPNANIPCRDVRCGRRAAKVAIVLPLGIASK